MADQQDSVSRKRVSGTVGSSFDPRSNSLNFIRLLLAGAVIVSHAGALTGRRELMLGDRTLGLWAVVGFFFLSGFLITRSRLARSVSSYYRDRALRILPGFVVAMLMTAFVFAPLGALASNRLSYDLPGAASYAVRNILTIAAPHFTQLAIGDMSAAGLSYPAWNGPIYTLFYEVGSYVFIAILVSVVPRRMLGPALIGIATALTGVSLVLIDSTTWGPKMGAFVLVDPGTTFVLAFALGALTWLYRDRVPLGPGVATVSAVIVIVVAHFGQSVALAPLPLGWVMLYAATTARLDRVGRRYDISYGLYIYGWPVQTFLLLAYPELSSTVPLLFDILATLAITAVFAFASCVLVELPALRLKKGSLSQDPRPTLGAA